MTGRPGASSLLIVAISLLLDQSAPVVAQTKIRTLGLWTFMILASGCAAPSDQAPAAFQHEIDGAALPWTHDRIDASGDQFTFALFSDCFDPRSSSTSAT